MSTERTSSSRLAVVTGASSGIGTATVRQLAKQGWTVICAARRVDRLEALAAEVGGRAVACDVTSAEDVARLASEVGPELGLLVNNAGGAFGQDPWAKADLGDWDRMYQVNVMGTARVTQALLPALEAGRGCIVFVTSTAAETSYEGGAGYNAAKSAERAMAAALRLEIVDKPIRVCEIAPGMVHTEEFSLVRFGGDQARADAVYAGVAEPLVAEDIAECISWMASRPTHVNIDRMVVRPRVQASNWKVHREG